MNKNWKKGDKIKSNKRKGKKKQKKKVSESNTLFEQINIFLPETFHFSTHHPISDAAASDAAAAGFEGILLLKKGVPGCLLTIWECIGMHIRHFAFRKVF